MKRIIILSAVFFMLHLSAQAQLTARAFLAPNISSFNLSDDYQDAFTAITLSGYQFRKKIDFGGGIGVGFNLDRVLIMGEIGFEQNKIVYEMLETFDLETEQGEILTGLISFQETLQRIPVNLITTIKVLGDESALTFTVGPSFGFGLKGKQSATFETATKTVPLGTEDISMGNTRFDEYKGLDFGFILGIGGVIPINENFQIFGDIRTRIGLTDMYSTARKNYLEDTEGVEILGTKKMRGTTFTVGVNYIIEVW